MFSFLLPNILVSLATVRIELGAPALTQRKEARRLSLLFVSFIRAYIGAIYYDCEFLALFDYAHAFGESGSYWEER